MADEIVSHSFAPRKQVYVTKGELVLSPQGLEMGTCDHEEADSRIFVNASHASQSGIATSEIGTVDSDIVVIAIGIFQKPKAKSILKDIYILFGTGKHLRRFSIKDICDSLGHEKATALPFLYCLSGTDINCAFMGKEKSLSGKHDRLHLSSQLSLKIFLKIHSKKLTLTPLSLRNCKGLSFCSTLPQVPLQISMKLEWIYFVIEIRVWRSCHLPRMLFFCSA